MSVDTGSAAATSTSPPTTAVRVQVLGPLQLVVDGRVVEVPGRRRRVVLALLALAGGHVVGADALVDAVWPDDPPETGHQALHSHVSRLRGHLGPAGSRLRRRGAGYALALEPHELDAAQVRQLHRTVTALLPVDPAGAAEAARAALAMWQAPALEEFADVTSLAAEAVGLDELFLQLRDDAVEARLAAGERAVAGDAAAAAHEQPLRERTATLLIRALAAEGRTAEAMAAAASYRRRLAEHTGLDPGPAVAALEQEVAGGTLAPPAPREPAAGPASARLLPRPTGPLIGRDHDRDDLHRLLEAHRTVTVTGPGGVGKTRLALDVAAGLSQGGAPVAVVTFAEVTATDRVVDAVVSTLGLRISGSASVTAVADALADAALLVVLDNCEHVAAACRELVAAVQARAPQVRVLATSRVTLHVPGEYVVRLQPLPLPRDAVELDALSEQPSVRAFVAHAQRRNRSFALTAENGPDVVEVIRRLDGLPLAMELAAGQLAVLPVDLLRDRLGRALDALSAGRTDSDARHRTLRATIDWSYRLLQDDERELVRALAVFPAGADLATVEWLAAQTTQGTDPLVLLGRLVDASLVAPDQQAPDRYTLLETVRAFLLDDLDGRGDRGEAERRFLAWARDTVRSIGVGLAGPDEAAADRRLRAELPNLRASRDLARRQGDVDLRIAVALALDDGALFRDVHELWAWSLELAGDPALVGHPQEVAVLGAAAQAAWLVGDLEQADTLCRRAFEIAGHLPDLGVGQLEAGSSAAAAVALFRGDYGAARAGWLRSAAVADHPASHLASAALAAVYAGDRPGAADLVDRAHREAAARPRPSDEAFAHYAAGELHAADDPEAAVAAYRTAVEMAQGCGAGFVEGVATVGLASVWTNVGDVAAAVQGYRLLLEYWQRTGNATQLWTTVRNAARLLIDHGRHAEAALLLAAADGARSAAVLTGDDAVAAQRLQTRLADRLGSAALEQVRLDARDVGTARAARVALGALTGLV